MDADLKGLLIGLAIIMLVIASGVTSCTRLEMAKTKATTYHSCLPGTTTYQEPKGPQDEIEIE